MENNGHFSVTIQKANTRCARAVALPPLSVLLVHTLPSALSPPVLPPGLPPVPTLLPPVLTLSPPAVLQMMNDHLELFGAQSHAKCADCGLSLIHI